MIENTTPWNVVAEYFRLFRYGLTVYVPVSKRCRPYDSPNVYESRMHREFLEATMAPNVIVDGGQGVEARLERWRFISLSNNQISTSRSSTSRMVLLDL